jgi:two-component system sensor histidine kinase UhpB
VSVARDIRIAALPLSSETELAVYRVAQEAMTNVARHSESDRATLILLADDQRLTLTLRDYGRGLPAEDGFENNGVRGMRERAALVGGKLTLGVPRHGPGTELTLEVPIGVAR